MIGAAVGNSNQSRNTVAPDITAFKKGDVFSMDVKQIATGAVGLRVELIVQYTGT
jgi:Holliday junction resolvase